MSSGSNTIFPILLDILSHKPELAESQKTLLKDLKAKLKKEDIKMKNLKAEYEAALEVGQSLGVIQIKNEDILLPINLRKRSRQSSPSPSTPEDKPTSSRRGRSRSSRRSRSRSTRSRSKSVRRRASRGRRSRRRDSA